MNDISITVDEVRKNKIFIKVAMLQILTNKNNKKNVKLTLLKCIEKIMNAKQKTIVYFYGRRRLECEHMGRIKLEYTFKL